MNNTINFLFKPEEIFKDLSTRTLNVFDKIIKEKSIYETSKSSHKYPGKASDMKIIFRYGVNKPTMKFIDYLDTRGIGDFDPETDYAYYNFFMQEFFAHPDTCEKYRLLSADDKCYINRTFEEILAGYNILMHYQYVTYESNEVIEHHVE